ncbi:MAG: helix-hairpin-helix domain-containing protein [Bacteroidota bacterium]
MRKSPVYKYYFLILLLLAFALLPYTQAQQGNQPNLDIQLIEDILQGNEDADVSDLIFVYESLQGFVRNPLNLNKATVSDLEDLFLLNQYQIQEFFIYKKKVGDLISLYELQAIPGFDLRTIQAILPFVKVSGTDNYQKSLSAMFSESDRALVSRWIRPLQKERGYLVQPNDSLPAYEGSPDRLIFRWRGRFENRLSYGFTAEKDDGESFFRGSNRQGFDFYSAHIFLNNYSERLQNLALGDFAVSMGQGLIAYSGFAGRKGADVLNINHKRRVLRQFASLNEILFFRGAGATIGITDKLKVTAFGSYRKVDGNIFENDSTNLDFLEFEILTSSLQTSGYHATRSEIADEKQIALFQTGAKIEYKEDTWYLALNTIYHQLDKPLNRSDQPYNRFVFSGDQLLNLSTDYGFLIQNFKFFGETALSDNGSVASVNGLFLGLDRKVSMTILHRYLPRDFHALNNSPFAETSQGANEQGLYLGLDIRLNKNWNWRLYYDQWKHPWLRFNVDAPSKGVEYLTRLTYQRKRQMEVYLQFRNEIKERNAPDNETPIDFLTNHRRTQLRLHLSSQLNKRLELRTRAEWSWTDNEVEPLRNGYLLYQDVVFKATRFPISFTTRYAIFDTDDYSARIYAYENDLLYTFSIPAYTGKGTRFYLNARYRPTKNWTIEARYERTFLQRGNVFAEGRLVSDEGFGSGNSFIEGNVRSAVEVQVQYEF